MSDAKGQVVYAHFDVEADGPSPAINNMVSFGILFTDETGKQLESLQMDLKPLPNHYPDQRTMDEFWSKNQEEWDRIKRNAMEPRIAMLALNMILQKFATAGAEVEWVANPAAYDWQWINYYWWHPSVRTQDFVDIGYSTVCQSTMRREYKRRHNLTGDQMKDLIAQWTEGLEMTHNPLDDARYQAAIFFHLMK